MKFLVIIKDIKTGEDIISTQVEKESSMYVIDQAKVQLRDHGFKFEKKKHIASWVEISS